MHIHAIQKKRGPISLETGPQYTQGATIILMINGPEGPREQLAVGNQFNRPGAISGVPISWWLPSDSPPTANLSSTTSLATKI